MSDPITEAAIRETRTAITLGRGVCPIVAAVWQTGRTDVVSSTDETVYCANCPDIDSIPVDCPEGERTGAEIPHGICILWAVNAKVPDGGCKHCASDQAEQRCVCFRPKGEAWHAAYQRWQQRRASAEATDASIKERRRTYALGQRGNQVIG